MDVHSIAIRSAIEVLAGQYGPDTRDLDRMLEARRDRSLLFQPRFWLDSIVRHVNAVNDAHGLNAVLEKPLDVDVAIVSADRDPGARRLADVDR